MLHPSKPAIIVYYKGCSFDVSSFVDVHPGGKVVLEQHVGQDITKVFDSIGHSDNARKRMETLKVVSQDDDDAENPQEPLKASEPSNMDVKETLDIKAFADGELSESLWHAKRRIEILEKYPHVADLIGPYPKTILVGLFACVLHACGALVAAWAPGPIYLPVLLAYTLGATCKMYHFAVAHEVCHGNILPSHWSEAIEKRVPFLTASFQHNILMRLFVLPQLSNEIYEYYTNGHLPHHGRLAGFALQDCLEDLVKTGAGFDGDLISPGTGLLRSRLIKGKPVKFFAEALCFPIDTNEWPIWVNSRMLFIAAPFVHIVNYLYMLYWALFCSATVLTMGICARINHFQFTHSQAALKKFEKDFADKPEAKIKMLEFIQRFMVMSGMGIEVFIAVALNAVLFGFCGPLASDDTLDWNVVYRGLAYLAISEMCMHGFLWHPCGAYFITVHRSVKPENGQKCQPTMSCYSPAAAWASAFLTYHVEHHDFPQVACWRLPEVTAAAPEFYSSLRIANGFCQTIKDYWDEGANWHYACQGFDDHDEPHT